MNLVLVSKSDGQIKPIEVLYLSRCKNKLDANHKTLADAIMRSYWEDVNPIGEMIGNEQTLKDMITMALMDGDIGNDERDIITKFIDVSKIPKNRIEILTNEAVARFNNELTEVNRENEVRLGRFLA
jgi:hypothetical protein